MNVDILLATRNGARFLAAQLDSLLAQDMQDFRLIVRDDGSTDETMEILNSARADFGDRLVMLEDGEASGSAKGNFARLMAVSEAPHILFSDQDDVWLPNHVSDIVALLNKAEAAHGTDTPIYAFTDVKAVSGDLTVLDESYFRFKKIDPDITGHLSQCIVCPPMLGCASGINRALCKLALPVPEADVTGHDWWCLLLAVACGKVTVSPEPTVLYRQHGGNASGQIQTSMRSYAGKAGKKAKVQRGMHLRARQAEAVAGRLTEQGLAPEAIETLRRFVLLQDENWLVRRAGLVQGRYLYPDQLRNLAMFALS